MPRSDRHDCFDRVDALLADKSTRLSCNLLNPNQVFVATEVTEKKRGRRPTLMVATFCPFCGKKVSDAPK